MNFRLFKLLGWFIGILAVRASAATYYVDINSTNPTPPYTSWSTAATNIQDAIVQTSPGDTVLVTNGIYGSGGVTNGSCVVVSNSITLQSVNGPAFTFIQAYPMSGVTNGSLGCVNLGIGATISGFTLMNGSTVGGSGGGIYSGLYTFSTISNCVITANTARTGGGGYSGSYYDCVISNNISTSDGGGIYEENSIGEDNIISNCVVIDNYSGGNGGGIVGAVCFYNSLISGNTSRGSSGGGGVYGHSGFLNCIISGNSAWLYGGGVYGYPASFTNCIISNNVCSDDDGGGVYEGEPGGTLNNCLIEDNDAGYIGNEGYGGGIITMRSILNNCTIAENAAPQYGGLYDYGGSVLTNCIVYYNSQSGYPAGESDITGTTSVYSSCTLTTNGLGGNNICAAPGFMNVDGGNFQLAAWSPCIDAGNNTGVTSTTDLAGSPRIVNGTVDMGAYEYQYPPFTNVVHYVVPFVPSFFFPQTNAVAPFTNWQTAATNIQQAIDTSSPGDYIVVSNGVYSTGGRAVNGGLEINRVAVDLPVTVQALSGTGVTTIQGNFSQVRCAYLTNGATMIGFTLISGNANAGNGNDDNGGGTWCESTNATVMSCIYTNDGANYYGGGAYSGTLIGCILNRNSGFTSGGGAYLSTLIGCTLNDNIANQYGGGAYAATLINCLLTNNYASFGGGGACLGILTNCLLVNNLANATSHTGGGGTCSNTLYNCLLSGNSSYWAGGGADMSVLNNCMLSGNLATNSGGGAYGCILTNCTLSGNGATNSGGGATYGLLVDCLVISNTAVNGGGCTSNTLYGCMVTGNVGKNIGGGCYFSIATNCTLFANSAVNSGGGAYGANLFNCTFSSNSAVFGGGANAATLTDCTLANNSALYGGGACSNVLNNCILVSNTASIYGGGVFGSTGTNCSFYGNTSVHGGGGAVLATLVSCFLSGNIAFSGLGYVGGAGAYRSTLISCVVSNNYSNTYGGGASYAVLTNCLIIKNSVPLIINGPQGGGTYQSYLNNCTVVFNSGGSPGVSGGATNCIIYYNTNGLSTNWAGAGYRNCCTFPLPGPGFGNIGNITNAPLFVDNNGDFHLQSSSPCINAGNNASVSVTADFDGNPRIQGGTVDIGCYEYQSPMSVISYAWLQQYGLPTDGSVDYSDLDGTAFDVYQDWLAGLNPTNPASVLAVSSPAPTNNFSGIVVSWQSVTNISYSVQRSTNLPSFTTIQSGIAGHTNSTSYTDTSATNNVPYFYRVTTP